MNKWCRLLGHRLVPCVIWETLPSGREYPAVSFRCERGCFED